MLTAWLGRPGTGRQAGLRELLGEGEKIQCWAHCLHIHLGCILRLCTATHRSRRKTEKRERKTGTEIHREAERQREMVRETETALGKETAKEREGEIEREGKRETGSKKHSRLETEAK